jgi:hypothetical protein
MQKEIVALLYADLVSFCEKCFKIITYKAHGGRGWAGE